MTSRRRFLHHAALPFALSAMGASHASNYPQKPVLLVNPFAAGGSLDNLLRILGQKVGDSLGQTIVVENRTGAGSMIGSLYVARARADGYTLLAQARNFTTAPALGAKLPYHWRNDFTPVILLGAIPQVLTVAADVPAHSVADLVKLAKAQPGTLSYGTLGDGSGTHLSGKTFEQVAGVSMTQIPFKGSAETLRALAGGHITMAFGNLPEVLTYHKGGRVRMLGIGSETRSELAPELPTMAEAGFPMVVKPWYGILAPARTPPDIITLLHREFAAALRQPEVVAKVREMGIIASGATPQEFARQMESEVKAFAELGRKANISLANQP